MVLTAVSKGHIVPLILMDHNSKSIYIYFFTWFST